MIRISKFLAKLSHWLLPVSCALLLFLLIPEVAEAGIFDSEGMREATGFLMMGFSFIITLIVLLAFLFSIGVGELLDSTFILDSGMGETLHLIWEVVRNFVNVAFVLILLIIAIMVIFKPGSEGGLGLLKKVSQKFILALVLVNLTFFAGRFILTVNDVLATAIFTIPKTVSGNEMVRLHCSTTDPSGKPQTQEGCQKEVLDVLKKSMGSGAAIGTKELSSLTISQQLQTISEKRSVHRVADMVGKKNIAFVLVSSMLDLDHLVYVKGGIGDLGDALIGAIGALITTGAVGIIIFMLFLALIVRMVVLWLCIAVSPVAALGIVMKDVIPGADMKGNFDILDVFIKHAFMPTMVAIPLSIGLVMIFANGTADVDYDLGKLFSFSDGLHVGNLHTILWWIASIIVIWYGTNEMIKKASPEFAAKITEGIHGGVNKFVGGAAGLIKYAPILPTSVGGSIGGAMIAPGAALQKIKNVGENKGVDAGQKLVEKILPGMASAPINTSVIEGELRSAAKTAKGKEETLKAIKSVLEKAENAHNGADALKEAKLGSSAGVYKKHLGGNNIKEETSVHDLIEQITTSHSLLSPTEKTDLINLHQRVMSKETGETPPVTNGGIKEEDLEKSGYKKSPTLENSSDGKGKIYILESTNGEKFHATKNADNSYTVKTSVNNIDNKVVTVGNGNGDIGIKALGDLKKFKDSITENQKNEIEKQIKTLVDKKEFDKSYKDDLQRAYKNLFGKELSTLS